MKGILSHTFQFMIFVAKISQTTRIILYMSEQKHKTNSPFFEGKSHQLAGTLTPMPS